MSFSESGYETESFTTIMQRIFDSFTSVVPNLEFTPDNIITHWQEILAYEQRLTQVMLAQAIDNFSVLTATGIFLTRLGIDAGITPKPAIASSGDLLITADSDSSYYISSGATFSTSDGRNYICTETMYFPDLLGITRGSSNEDYVPSPYKNATITDIYYDGNLETGVTGEFYSISGDFIVWTNSGLISGITEGNIYYADLSGSVGMIVPVISEDVGSDYNVSANRITIDNNGYSYVESVTNEEPFYNGSDIESDENYRYRILKAKRKTFALSRIETLCENIVGVRDAKTYQVTNTDRNSLDTDWETSGSALSWDLNNLNELTGNVFVPSGLWFGFSFYPSEEIATIKEVILYGRITGEVPENERVYPKLEAYLKPHYSGLYNIDTGYYLEKSYIEKYDLERDSYDDWQEIKIPIKYNGIDNSKTYRLYFFESGYVDAATGHWEFAYSGIAVSSGYRNETYIEGTGQEDNHLLFRTMYGAPAYNIDIIPEDSYRFDPEIKEKVEMLLNYEQYGGNSPVCIQYNIRQSTKTYLSLSMYLFVLPNYTFADVVSDIKTNVGTYLRTIKSDGSIYYTMLEKAVINTDGVLKIKDMRMKLNDGEWVTRETQDDIALAEKEYVDLDLNSLYDGVSIYEG